MPLANASCGPPSERSQRQGVLPAQGLGGLRAGLAGASTCTASQVLTPPNVSQATLPPSWAIASIGPLGLFRKVWQAGGAAAASPARTRSPAVARSART